VKLEDLFRKTVQFLERYKFPYLIIGGIAAGVLGEPRTTGDIDIDINIKKNSIKDFLNLVKKAGFIFNRAEVMKSVKETGTFKLWLGDFHIDFIIASTKFEANAFLRKQKIKLFRTEANFPSNEDMILLKIIPDRPIDKFDAENITKRHKGKLDEKYLLEWAMKLSEEAEDLRVYNEVKKLLD
jgi:hypothetical protein